MQTLHRLLPVALFLGLAACDGDASSSKLPPATCDEAAPTCLTSCGSDVLLQPACDADGWSCGVGVSVDSCPPGVCPDNPQMPCVFVTPCVATATSSLPGVALEITATECGFTQSEVAAGIELGWAIVTNAQISGVRPSPQDAGGCDQPDASGLIPFERLSGGDETYCLCDTGLCQGPSDTPVTLPVGTFPGTFVWDGVNWSGPSDTGNPKGAAFPPGSYELSVSAKGTRTEGNQQVPFEVEVRVGIEISEDP